MDFVKATFTLDAIDVKWEIGHGCSRLIVFILDLIDFVLNSDPHVTRQTMVVHKSCRVGLSGRTYKRSL